MAFFFFRFLSLFLGKWTDGVSLGGIFILKERQPEQMHAGGRVLQPDLW
jgi:hypothetical protein